MNREHQDHFKAYYRKKYKKFQYCSICIYSNSRNILIHKIHLFLHSIYLLHFSRIKNTLPQIFSKILSKIMMKKYEKKQIVFENVTFMTHFNWVSTRGMGWGWDHYLLGAFLTFLLLCSHAFTSGVDSGVGFVWSMVYISFPCFQSWYLSGWNFFTKISIEIFTMSFLQVHWNIMGLECFKHFTSYIKSHRFVLWMNHSWIFSHHIIEDNVLHFQTFSGG